VLTNHKLALQGFESDIKDFSGNKLSEIQKQANALQKDCSDPDKKKLQNVMQGMK
jgi:hypothetical protein